MFVKLSEMTLEHFDPKEYSEFYIIKTIHFLGDLTDLWATSLAVCVHSLGVFRRVYALLGYIHWLGVFIGWVYLLAGCIPWAGVFIGWVYSLGRCIPSDVLPNQV